MATVVSPSRAAFLSLAVCFLFAMANAQQNPAAKIVALRASRMLDVKSGSMVRDAVVLIQDQKITAAGPSLKIPAGAEVVDLGNVTLLPGLIDCHTHLMARISDEDPQSYGLSLLTKSQAFRALEGAADARVTLRAGFTAVRDVESEGSGYADVALPGCDQSRSSGRSAHAGGDARDCRDRPVLSV
jgi:imidazolonepropionase-like amidohydrolase